LEFPNPRLPGNRGFFVFDLPCLMDTLNPEKHMNRIKTALEPQFSPEISFALTPSAPFRLVTDTELERLKGRLLQQALQEATDPELCAPLRRAANEAAALAWINRYPLLLFPLLFEEKAQRARHQTARQAEIRRGRVH
jgi:hypothetical protein